MRLRRREAERGERHLMERLEVRALLSASAFGKLPMPRELRCAAATVARAEHQTTAIGRVRQDFNRRSTTQNSAKESLPEAGAIVGDMNNDGTVDLADFDVWLRSVGDSTGGDINHDGHTDIGDFDIWYSHVGTDILITTAPPPPAYDWHTQTLNGVLNVWAPNPSDFGSTFQVTDPTALFGSDGVPTITSVHQGGVPDCYFLATIGSVANVHPDKIQQLVTNDSGGGWAVTYYWFNPNSGVTSPVVIHTSSDLSSTWQTVTNGEVWSEVMEKAYAAFRTWNGATSTNTMASIGWGFSGTVMQHLGVGYMTAGYSTGADAAYNTLTYFLNLGRPIDFHTSSSATTMVASHVYVISGVHADAAGTKWVTTYNPWGFYEDRTVANLLTNGIGYFVVGQS